MENKQKVRAIVVFEMIGRPVEHLKETMNKFVETVVAEKGIKLIEKRIHEPKKLKQDEKDEKAIRFEGNPELFSTFSEIEIETENILGIVAIVFKYMPAHIEIIEPHEFETSNLDMGFIINEILLKLHNYDAVAKSAIMQNQMLAQKLKELLAKYPEEATGLREAHVSQKLEFEPSEKESKKKKKSK